MPVGVPSNLSQHRQGRKDQPTHTQPRPWADDKSGNEGAGVADRSEPLKRASKPPMQANRKRARMGIRANRLESQLLGRQHHARAAFTLPLHGRSAGWRVRRNTRLIPRARAHKNRQGEGGGRGGLVKGGPYFSRRDQRCFNSLSLAHFILSPVYWLLLP